MSSKSDNSEVAPQKPKQAGIGGDIEIPAEQANAFFFMDSDEEAKTYGATTQSSIALTGTILKSASKQKAAQNKQIVDFKIRVLDFISIYVKEMRKRATEQAALGIQPTAELDAMRIIKGLLKALQVAHQDKNTVLFDRIKSVLSQIARGSGKQSQDDAGA